MQGASNDSPEILAWLHNETPLSKHYLVHNGMCAAAYLLGSMVEQGLNDLLLEGGQVLRDLYIYTRRTIHPTTPTSACVHKAMHGRLGLDLPGRSGGGRRSSTTS